MVRFGWWEICKYYTLWPCCRSGGGGCSRCGGGNDIRTVVQVTTPFIGPALQNGIGGKAPTWPTPYPRRARTPVSEEPGCGEIVLAVCSADFPVEFSGEIVEFSADVLFVPVRATRLTKAAARAKDGARW